MVESGSFIFKGERLKYMDHPYMDTIDSERAIELPIAFSMIRERKDSEVLEVGNVLRHYYPERQHTVVDLFDKPKYTWSLKKDILTYKPGRQFNMIVSVSTVEHIGTKNYKKNKIGDGSSLKAIDAMRGLLSPGGTMFVTFPVGCNEPLDCGFSFEKEIFYKKISKLQWEEVSREEAMVCRYGDPHLFANAIVIGIDGPQ